MRIPPRWGWPLTKALGETPPPTGEAAPPEGESPPEEAMGMDAVPDPTPDLEAADLRLGQEMARCASEYDQAVGELAARYPGMQQENAALSRSLQLLAPTIDSVLEGSAPLNPDAAIACLRYLAVCAELRKVRQGMRQCYAATLPPGTLPLGRALGDRMGPESEETDATETDRVGTESVGAAPGLDRGARDRG